MGHVQVPFSCFLKILEIGTVMPQQIGDNYLAFVRDLKLKLKIKKTFLFSPTLLPLMVMLSMLLVVVQNLVNLIRGKDGNRVKGAHDK